MFYKFKHQLYSFLILSILSFISYNVAFSNENYEKEDKYNEISQKEELNKKFKESNISKNSQILSKQQTPKISFWLVLPFILLLGMIATGPLFYSKFWHKNYIFISVGLSIFVLSIYLFKFHNLHTPISAAFEYLQFISLIGTLYIASSGIFIKINSSPSPLLNLLILFFGSIISNLIGTTGASMLLIKPFIRLNKNRIKVYHIIFFIFMVSNVGGALTPIGDPPLFLGFLKGIPFFWTFKNNVLPWLFTLICLGTIFYVLEKKNNKNSKFEKFSVNIIGKKNFLWLSGIIICVFLDPNIFDWVPSIRFHEHKHSFLREMLLIIIGLSAFKNANKTALKENEFSLEPLKEIVFIFIGIFGTMAPALEMISSFAQSEYGKSLINHSTLYWGAGTLSSFLDNAPTYLNFLAASMSSQGADISNLSDVQAYAQGDVFTNSILNLKSIAVSSVFFGAMTYIGNGPNFMVKAIAEKMGIKMPSFFGYVLKYSLTLLLPILFMNWILFFK